MRNNSGKQSRLKKACTGVGGGGGGGGGKGVEKLICIEQWSKSMLNSHHLMDHLWQTQIEIEY